MRLSAPCTTSVSAAALLQVYMPYPSEVWRELHAIYRYAVEHGLRRKWWRCHANGTKTTLVHDYIRVLLLGLSNPYQLPQNECRHVQRFLTHWVPRPSCVTTLRYRIPPDIF